MDNPVPKRMFFTRGVGRHRHNLQAFEDALRAAGIAQFNLVKVSSIFPPHCKIVSRAEGLKSMRPGQIAFCVMAEERTNEPNRMVSAGIGLAVPAAGEQYGYIAEHHGFGMTERRTADLVEDMAASMLASTLGVDFDPDADYDERREIYRMSGRIVNTRATVQTARGDKNGLWTTVVAAAILLFD
ncbi:MAG: arginine decarboxylase, pyruvoyl-dependent [Planctomycetota bacterium]|nr:MAG: arginine decarboxylase, pyruvoyl-dependent [Planctomycetota bacterium]